MNDRLPLHAATGADQGPAAAATPTRPRALVSVRSVDEALAVARAGVTLIDLKEPRDGALGGLPPGTVAAIVGALRQAGFAGEISATIGDHAATELAAIGERIEALAATGIDVIKVGVTPQAGHRGPAQALLHRLAGEAGRGRCLVPVLIADLGLEALPVAQALAGPFHAVMLDTQDKLGGSLPQRLGLPALADFVQQARAAGRRCGLAGALRLADWPVLAAQAPADFLGFRSAVCQGTRSGQLDPARLDALRQLGWPAPGPG